MLTSTMDTVGTLLLRSETDRSPEADDGGLVLLETGSGDRIVNSSKVAERKSDIKTGMRNHPIPVTVIDMEDLPAI